MKQTYFYVLLCVMYTWYSTIYPFVGEMRMFVYLIWKYHHWYNLCINDIFWTLKQINTRSSIFLKLCYSYKSPFYPFHENLGNSMWSFFQSYGNEGVGQENDICNYGVRLPSVMVAKFYSVYFSFTDKHPVS